MKKLLIFVSMLVLVMGAGCKQAQLNNTSTNNSTNTSDFRIYLVKNNELLVSSEDIVSYDPVTYTFTLTDETIKRLDKHSVYGPEHISQLQNGLYQQEFSIMLNGKVLLTGAFWSSLSSQSRDGLVLLDSTMFPSTKELKLVSAYPGTSEIQLAHSIDLEEYFRSAGKLRKISGSIEMGYKVTNENVQWSNRLKTYTIANVDISTFKIIKKGTVGQDDFDNDWAKDKNHIFYQNTVVTDADPSSFTLIDSDFSKDKNHVFFNLRHAIPIGIKIIEGADPSSFEIVNKNHPQFGMYYSKDKNHVFLDSEIIPDADPKSFEKIDTTWAKDKNYVFFEKTKVPNADPKSFQRIGIFEKDKNHVYLQGKLVSGADPKSFMDLGKRYFKDKNRVYYITEILPNADPNSFEVLENESFYSQFAKDKNKVYFRGVIFPVDDPETFEIISCDEVKDKVRTYEVPLGCPEDFTN